MIALVPVMAAAQQFLAEPQRPPVDPNTRYEAVVIKAPPGAPAPPIDPNTPSLTAALQEQLGVKLEATRGPVEIVVIDKFEKPTLE